MTTVPNPGSKEAREQGCLCPVVGNEFGKGYLGRGDRFGFVFNQHCPLHSADIVGSGKPWSSANQLESAIKRFKHKQDDVAKMLCISDSSLSRIIHGHQIYTRFGRIDGLVTQEDLKQYEETMKKSTYTQDAIEFTTVKYIKQEDWKGQIRNTGCMAATLVQLTNDNNSPYVVAIGVSLCNLQHDKFDKKIARDIAISRAKKHWKEYKLKNKYLYGAEDWSSVPLKDIIDEFIQRCMRYYKDKSILHPKIIFV